jgi:1,4-alpha-glucan branching enzyme
MSIQKKYLKGKRICLVKFRLPPDTDNSSKKVYLVGDFNNWDRKQTQMRKRNNGSYSAVVELKMGNEYQFRYLTDETHWENDSDPYMQAHSPFQDSWNSVVVI